MTKLVPLCLLLVACGSVANNNPSDPGADAAVDADPDPTTPSVLAVVPADGATGVTAAASIVVRFNTAMDQASVEAAWQSSDLPPEQLAFAWDEAGRTLTVTPTAPLELATGVGLDPSVVAARAYGYSIGTTAKSLGGSSLDQTLDVSFTTLRRLEIELAAVAVLTRTIVADGSVFSSGATGLVIGDSAENLQTKSFSTFSLPTLPDGATLEAATFRTFQNDVDGTPYAFGDLLMFHTSHPVIDSSVFAATPLDEVGALSVDPAPGARSLDVTTQLADDLANRVARGQRTQYRLEFPTPNNANNAADNARFSRNNFGIDVAYVIP